MRRERRIMLRSRRVVDAGARPPKRAIRSHGDASRFDFHADTIVPNAFSDGLDPIRPVSTHTRQA